MECIIWVPSPSLSIPSLKQSEAPLKPGRSSEPRPAAVALTLRRPSKMIPDRLIGALGQPGLTRTGRGNILDLATSMGSWPSMTNLTDIFVGDDIGKSFHCPAAINARGHVLLKPVKVIASAEAFTAFEGRLDRLGDKTAVVIGLEASGHDWMSPWRFLLERD